MIVAYLELWLACMQHAVCPFGTDCATLSAFSDCSLLPEERIVTSSEPGSVLAQDCI